MKLLEAIIGIFILSIIMVSATSILGISKARMKTYISSIKDDANKISLYNYSNDLIMGMTGSQSGYIYFSGNNFYTGAQGDYAYSCELTGGTYIKINQSYTGVFCEIEFDKDKIFNYKILE